MPDTQTTRTASQRRAERDRQELWHLESFLMVNGTNKGHQERRLRLYRYLCETCPHDYQDVSGWGGCPKGTHQCSWCNVVLDPDEWLAHRRAHPGADD